MPSFISNLSKPQLFGLVGFALVLLSIPVGFTLVKESQILGSKAAETNRKSITSTESQTSKRIPDSKEIPINSPLTDLRNTLAKNATASSSKAEPTPTPVPGSNLSFGPTLNMKLNLEGRPTNKQAAKVFVGLASGNIKTRPTYLLTFTIDLPDNGIFNGLSLAGLEVGSTYTAYLKGPSQIDAAATFTMSPSESTLQAGEVITLLSGDLNEDNTINTADYTLAKRLYGTTLQSSNWNSRADFNADNVINNYDLAYITKNFGKTGASGVWQSSPTSSSGSAQLNLPASSGGPSSPSSSTPSGGYWLFVPSN